MYEKEFVIFIGVTIASKTSDFWLDDDDLSGSESMLISPVKKVAGGASMRSGSSFLEDSSRNHQNLRY